jgi:hypothetical protein
MSFLLDRDLTIMRTPPVVSAQEWEQAREALLVREKVVTRAQDALAAERRRMPGLAVVGRRACAVGAMCSAVLHGLSLGHVTSPPAAVLMTTMILGCLFCARELWLTDTLQGWTLVALMNLVMIAIHLPMSGHHHGGGTTAAAMAPESTAMTLATGFAVTEALVATAVLVYRTRGTRLSSVECPNGPSQSCARFSTG